MADVFYSVGQSAGDLKTDSPTITITSGIATFSIPQIGNIGVGDRITHIGGDTLCYISSKISTSVWNVISAIGTTPTNVTDQSVTSINREYTSLGAAEAGASDINHLNTVDLVSNNFNLNFPCYYDSGFDNGVTVSGWTTNATYYIKFYTPNNIINECNVSQRHEGVWSDTKFRCYNTSPSGGIFKIEDPYIRIIGMQLEVNYTGTSTNRYLIGSTESFIFVDSCLGKGHNNNYDKGIVLSDEGCTVQNTVVYNCNGTNGMGISCVAEITAEHIPCKQINCTVINCNRYAFSGNADYRATHPIAINCVGINCGADPFNKTAGKVWDEVNSMNNAANVSSAIIPGGDSIDLTNDVITDYFKSSSNFHINRNASNSYELLSTGVGPDVNADVPILDFEGNVRSGITCDIGADETSLRRIFIVSSN